MESKSVLDTSEEEFNALEWNDQIDTLFAQLNVILASEREEHDAILTAEEAPTAPPAPSAPEEQVEADPTAPTIGVAKPA